MSPRILFAHNNFPAQFADLAQQMIARQWTCAALSAPSAPGLEGVIPAHWTHARGSTPGLMPLATRAEADLIRGYGAYLAAKTLKAGGFTPDLIIGHPGWGETVLLDEVFPGVPQIQYAEFFYRAHGTDIDFDDEFLPPTEQMFLAGKAKNAVMALSLSDAKAIVAPTMFQASVLPEAFRARTRIIHEGVDVEAIQPRPPRSFTLPDGRILTPETPVITHVNRSLEPLRGLHILLRALPQVQAAAPDAHVVIVGSESERGYSGTAPDGQTWKAIVMAGLEDRLDLSRIHFVGRLPHEMTLDVIRLSRAHVYYTYPFVLSWSLVEAMAAGAYVIGSDTAPVRDAITDGVNGKLLPFFDVDALAEALIEACGAPADAYAFQRGAARRTAVSRFSREDGRKAWFKLIDEVLNG